MLSDSSYLTAIYTYVGAALAALIILAWWLGRSWRAGWAALAVLVSAALLLTPAYPNADTVTFAPALVVAVFEMLTYGPEAAEHAFRPLIFMLAVAVVVAIVLRLLVFRRRKAPDQPETDSEQPV
ncbi:MAG: hypothetical protein V7746_05705 [Halioglobus sp.]